MALSPELLTVYLLAVSTLVAALISQVVKPLVERIPELSPSLPDQTLHNAVLRGVNLLLTVVAVLTLAAVHGQLTLANALPTTGAVLAIALGSHAVYQLVKPPPASTASTPLQPLHQQAAPPADASAI